MFEGKILACPFIFKLTPAKSLIDSLLMKHSKQRKECIIKQQFRTIPEDDFYKEEMKKKEKK